MVMDLLAVDPGNFGQSLAAVTLAGRQQRPRQGRPGVDLVLDVAHNPDAVRALFGELGRLRQGGRQYLVFACMADKDVQAMVAHAMDAVDAWHVTDFDDPRALPAAAATAAIRAVRPDAAVREHATVGDALGAALDEALPGDRVVVFGSFRIVAAAMEQDL